MKRKYRLPWQTDTPPADNRLPVMTGFEMTRLTWAKRLETYKDVPPIYHAFFSTILHDPENLPYTILTPSYEGFLNPTVEKLACMLDDSIYIVQRRKNELLCTGYSVNDISHVERGTDLLNSWLVINGRSEQGENTSSTLRFNTVTEYLINPLLERIRPMSDPDSRAPRAEFDHLARDHYKFMNFARFALRPGDRVLQDVMQPEVRKRVARLLGWSYFRTVSPAFLVILTDRELIRIREYGRRREGRQIGYGHIWTYIPRRQIKSVAVAPGRAEALVVNLASGVSLEWFFPTVDKGEVKALARAIAVGPLEPAQEGL